MSGPVREIPPDARDAVDAIAAAPTVAAKRVVIGGIGTGKTSTLTAIRAALRASGVNVTGRVPSSGPTADVAVVVDDAHVLTDAELRALATWADHPAATVVVAAEPQQHRAALRALVGALEREDPPVVLGAL